MKPMSSKYSRSHVGSSEISATSPWEHPPLLARPPAVEPGRGEALTTSRLQPRSFARGRSTELGKGPSPEEKGEVDVGKSEIDYDHDKGDDEEEAKRKAKGKGNQAPPKGRGKKPKAKPGEDEEEEQQEAEGRLRRFGGHLRHLGHRAGHGTLAQKAKERLRQRLHRFATKHGIDPEAAKEAKRKAREAKKAAKKKEKKPTAHFVGPGMRHGGDSEPKKK